MTNKLNNKRIDGAALELIMRDVLDGMFDFTSQAYRGCEAAHMEIVAVEKPGARIAREQEQAASIIPFPGKKRS